MAGARTSTGQRGGGAGGAGGATGGRARATHATLPPAREAAEALLLKGNAVDAVVAGVFAAAAAEPSVLLGPVQLLFGGGGAGHQAVSGRLLQSGKGIDRPRGFRDGDRVPDAARVAVPALSAALVAALATAGQASLSQVVGPAVELARGTPRRAVLAEVARLGPRAMCEGTLAEELVHAANRVAGGTLTREDLDDVRVAVERCALEPAEVGADGEPRGLLTVPWGSRATLPSAAEGESGLDARNVHAVLAVDRNGLFALAVFEVHLDVLPIPELGLAAPLVAQPVRRGTPRVRPGTVLDAAFPAGLIERRGAFELGLVVVQSPSGEADARALLARAVSGERPQSSGARMLAVAQTGDRASAFG